MGKKRSVNFCSRPRFWTTYHYEQESSRIPASVSLSCVMIDEIVQISVLQRKAKTLLNYIFIFTLYFCFYIVSIDYYYVFFELQRYKIFVIIYLLFFEVLNPIGFRGVALASRS